MRLVTATGNTVRVKGLGGTHLVLVVADNAASQWWFQTLLRNGHPLVRHFITDRDRGWRRPPHGAGPAGDLRALGARLSVQPRSKPAFLVCVDGWFVDWFPAPSPATPDNPAVCLRESGCTRGRAPPASMLHAQLPGYSP